MLLHTCASLSFLAMTSLWSSVGWNPSSLSWLNCSQSNCLSSMSWKHWACLMLASSFWSRSSAHSFSSSYSARISSALSCRSCFSFEGGMDSNVLSHCLRRSLISASWSTRSLYRICKTFHKWSITTYQIWRDLIEI